LNILFSKKDEEQKEEGEERSESLLSGAKDGYETVNEGMTTDTTEANAIQ